MIEGIFLDIDILLKICAYQCHMELLDIATIDGLAPATLRVGQYSLRSRISRSTTLSNPAKAKVALDEILARIRLLDPNSDEIGLAVEIEEKASMIGLQFDTGESQLLAMLLKRGAQLLLTGDKRAIKTVGRVGPIDASGKIACLEQLFLTLLERCGIESLRGRVCHESVVDKAITVCFACYSDEVSLAGVRDGLVSYIAHIRNESGGVIFSHNSILSVVA
jgi:hypothetical protein